MAEGKDEKAMKIDMLHERHPGLTAALGGTFSEAASVCLDRHHGSPVELEIVGTKGTEKHTIDFRKPDQRVLNAWANEIDTTEAGAYGVCLAAVEVHEGLVAVRRAETLTGADWYVAPVGDEAEDLERCFRLEVSGVDSGGQAVVNARLKQKIDQTRRGASNLPAIASVVGFKELAIAIQRVSENK